MKHTILKLAIALMLGLVSLLALINPPSQYYPQLRIDVPDDKAASSPVLTMGFIFEGKPSLASCEAVTGNISRVTLAQCPQCRIRDIQCKSNLEANETKQLSNTPLSVVSGRMLNGSVVYEGIGIDQAFSICQESVKAAYGKVAIACYLPGTTRHQPKRSIASIEAVGFSLLIFLSAMAASALVCWLILRYEHLHARFTHDHTSGGPQKFHATPTPRVGGLGLITGLLAAAGAMMLTEQLPHERMFSTLLLASMPAFLGGLIEDITKKVGVMERLLLTMLAGASAAWLLGAVLPRVDIPLLDTWLLFTPIALLLTIFAVGGIANAINILDGYNGLAAGYAFIILIALATVAGFAGDLLILPVSLALAGALLGFLRWNWPGGRIFLGDGGAYLLGFMLAEFSVLLILRNPQISSWFPFLLLCHPIFETLFSIYRRKLRRGQTPGRPDALHLHQLIYSRIVRHYVGSRQPYEKLKRNSKVAPYFWGLAIALGIGGVLFHGQTIILASIVFIHSILYVTVYSRITAWKMQKARFRF